MNIYLLLSGIFGNFTFTDIGGFVGLLLGYSVADVNSILQWIFYWMMRKIK